MIRFQTIKLLGALHVTFTVSSALAEEAAESAPESPQESIVTQRALELAATERAMKDEGVKKEIESRDEKIKETEAEVAVAKTEQVKAEATTSRLAELSSGTLVEKVGVTGGVGLALQIPTSRLKNMKAVTMPYVALLPGYWQGGMETNRYCASLNAGGDRLAAQEAADVLAKARGMKKLDVIIGQLSSSLSTKNKSVTQAVSVIAPQPEAKRSDTNPARKKETKALVFARFVDLAGRVWDAMYPESVGPDDKPKKPAKTLTDDQKSAFAIALYSSTWLLTVEPNCWGKRFGLFVGVPLHFEAQTDFKDQDRDKRKVKPQIAFGGVFAFNAWLHLMAGVTYAEVTIETTDSDGDESEDFKGLWTPTVGLGGTLDIVNLFK